MLLETNKKKFVNNIVMTNDNLIAISKQTYRKPLNSQTLINY